MPALTNSRVGSFWGTSGADCTFSWPSAAKKSRKVERIWFRLAMARSCRGSEKEAASYRAFAPKASPARDRRGCAAGDPGDRQADAQDVDDDRFDRGLQAVRRGQGRSGEGHDHVGHRQPYGDAVDDAADDPLAPQDGEAGGGQHVDRRYA